MYEQWISPITAVILYPQLSIEKIGMHKEHLRLPSQPFVFRVIHTFFCTFKQPKHFLMLPLPTDATTESMSISTDWRHPFHTCNNHNLFSQFGFTEQIIMVNTNDAERDMEILNGKGHWDTDASATISASQWFQYFNGGPILLYWSTIKLVSELSFFFYFIACHYSDKLQLWLKWSSKNM